MKAAVILLTAVVLSGCSEVMAPRWSPYGGPYDANVERLKESVLYHQSDLLEFTLSDSRSDRFQPGLSILAKTAVGAGKTFVARAVVGNKDWKPVKAEWDRNAVKWILAPAFGGGASIPPLREKRTGAAMSAEFRVDAPGVYRLRCEERPRAADPDASSPFDEAVLTVVVE